VATNPTELRIRLQAQFIRKQLQARHGINSHVNDIANLMTDAELVEMQEKHAVQNQMFARNLGRN